MGSITWHLGFDRMSNDRVTDVGGDFSSVNNTEWCIWLERCWQAHNLYIFFYISSYTEEKKFFYPELAVGINLFVLSSVVLKNSSFGVKDSHHFSPLNWDGAENNTYGILLLRFIKVTYLGRFFSLGLWKIFYHLTSMLGTVPC